MYYLIYISASETGVGEVEMHDILTESINNNEPRNLTGLLVYDDGMFIQMLEGAKEDVEFVFEKIKKDERHFDVRTLSCGQHSRGIFQTGVWPCR